MRYILLTVLVLSITLPITAEAKTWHVEPDSSGQVINIQAGIDSAAAGDTVLVAPGIYTGDGNWELDFKGKSIVVRSTGNDGVYGKATISAFVYPWDTHYAFHFHSGEDTTSVLEGFNITIFSPVILIEDSSPTIRNNYIDAGYYSSVGIHCENSRAIIENNWLYMGDYSDFGIYCRNSHALIKNNVVRTGMDFFGSGIHCESDSSIIMDNIISGNEYPYSIYCQDSHNIITGNSTSRGQLRFLRGSYEICDNRISGAYWADGIVCDSCNTVISNNYIEGAGKTGLVLYGGSHMISGNSIKYSGRTEYGTGGVYLRSVDSNTVFTGNIIHGNWGGGYLYVGGIVCSNASPIISDNIIANNQRWGNGNRGGIFCIHSSPLIIRNTIAYNTSFGGEGNGIYCYQSSPRIENCIITYNGLAPPPYGGGIYCEDELSVPMIMNCNVYGHGGDYYGIPDQTGINGNFSLAPIFCDPDNLEFTLHALSPCLPENNPYGPECGLIGALGVGCNFVATLLQSFNAEYDDSAVRIEWKVSEASDISDFAIYRAAAPDWEFLAVNDPELDGGGTSYRFRDRDISPGATYKYRVLVFDESAARVLFETDRVTVPAMPLALNQNYPNPFNPSTRITYQVPADDRVTLDIYDVSGRLVIRLVDGVQETGSHSVDWNGTNSNGNDVSSGTYFYRLNSGKEVISKKMVLLR